MPARRLPTQPGRAVAVIWDLHVFISQLIECEISLSVISGAVRCLRNEKQLKRMELLVTDLNGDFRRELAME